MNSRAAVAAVLIVAALVIVAVLLGTARPVAAPEPTPTPSTPPPTASASPTATPSPVTSPGTSAPTGTCLNDYLAGETPIVPPRKSGTFAEVALDAVVVGPGPFGTTARWRVRAFNPIGSPGTFELPLRATVRSSAGADLPILGYEYGPPNAEAIPTTEPVAIDPCAPGATPGTRQRGKAVLVVHSAPITSGTYTLTLRDLKPPEGGTREEAWGVTLACVADPGPAAGLNCRRS
jgi:hypothetical protein